MIATFTALLFAHALADFVLQTNAMVARKREPLMLVLHGLVVLITAQAATGSVAWPLLVLAAAHIVIDMIKTYALPDGLWTFLGDQAAHLATIAATATLFPTLWDTGLWSHFMWLPAIMATVAGLLVTTLAGGFAIAFLVAPWRDIGLPVGLPNGGRLIGTLERGLVFLLIMVGQPAGIGFLIAAKSVLRFDTTKDQSSIGEYVIVGTLASFGWALTTSYATLAILSHLPPLGIWSITP